MTSFWKIAAPIISVAVICGAVIFWSRHKENAIEAKVAAATVCRMRAEHGDAHAQFELGNMYRKGQGVPQNYAEAVSWFRKAANQSDADAQYSLGNMYRKGLGTP